MFKCKKCGNKEATKAGFNGGKQRYRCKSCKKFQVIGDERIKYENEMRQRAIILYLENSGIRSIARVLSLMFKQKIYYQTVAKWLKHAGETLEEKLNEIKEQKNGEIIEVLEIDELHTYIKKNQKMVEQKLEYGLLLTEIGTKLLKF